VQSGVDTGDAAGQDIGDWGLLRSCEGRFQLFLQTVDAAPRGLRWMEIDSAPGGCQGVDRVAVIRGWGTADLISTPGCTSDTWTYIRPVHTAGPDLPVSFLWLSEADVGAPAFHWRAFASVAGAPWTTADAVPNSGRAYYAG
jgi:hypothetical protein